LKKSLIITFIFLLLGIGQSKAAEPDTLFLDANWNITKNRALAKYYRETFFDSRDSSLTVHDYYLSTGNYQMIGTYMKEMKSPNQTGVFQFYYPDGTRKAIYNYHHGQIHGELRRYYRNGKIKIIENFDLGHKVDTIVSFFDNGQLHKVQVINKKFSRKNPSDKFKQLELVKAFTKEGIQQIDNGNGIYTEYFLNGKKRIEVEYMNGFPHGKWTRYTGRKKKVACRMVFKEGRFIKGEIYENGKKDIFSSLRRTPYFHSGTRGLDKFIEDHIGQCKGGFENEILVMILVSTDGHVEMEQILSGNVNACQLEQVQNLIRNMPAWVPAVQDGQYVEASKTIKIKL
jgi:antitoxin component YwqK of YwqJK toxin-antitoxin module